MEERSTVLHKVFHRNMFRTPDEKEFISDPEGKMIYCRKEGKVCIPYCAGCKFYAGNEGGLGIDCTWDDKNGNVSENVKYVKYSDRYKEAFRDDRRLDYDFDYDETNVDVILAMSKEQAEMEHRSRKILPDLPYEPRAYFRIDYANSTGYKDRILGWNKTAIAYKKNAKTILRDLFPNMTDFDKYLKAIDQIEGDVFYILAFGDKNEVHDI